MQPWIHFYFDFFNIPVVRLLHKTFIQPPGILHLTNAQDRSRNSGPLRFISRIGATSFQNDFGSLIVDG